MSERDVDQTTCRYAPDNLERCQDHPDALVRHIFDADVYAWRDGRTSAPIRRRTVGYECAACCRQLMVMETVNV